MSSCMHSHMRMIVAVDPLIHVPSYVVQLKESCLFKQGLKEGAMKSEPRRWINFARYTNPPIGKAQCLDAVTDFDIPAIMGRGIYLHIKYEDGHEYAGWLTQKIAAAMPIQEEE